MPLTGRHCLPPEHFLMPPLPLQIPSIFIFTTLLTFWFVFRAIRNAGYTSTRDMAPRFVILALIWLVGQAILGLTGFYTDTSGVPPRTIWLILPPLLVIMALFIASKQFVERVSAETLTYLHIVRLPVEIGLFWLAQQKLIPEEMTFSGHNFDIIMGLTSPIIAYFGYTQTRLFKPFLLGWNVIGLVFLLIIVAHGILALPSVLQMYAFEQPNRAMLYFPFLWLPSFIVPSVLFAHLACIRQLIK